jgi:CRP-like cAMP-binding protein
MGRVCAALLDLADEDGTLKNITQKSLVERTGASREAVNRTLQNLQDAGYITVSKRLISLYDRSALT